MAQGSFGSLCFFCFTSSPPPALKPYIFPWRQVGGDLIFTRKFMATQAQLANAERFYQTIRQALGSLKAISSAYTPAINFYNGLSAGQKTALLALKNIDQTELESALSTLSTITTSINTLPGVEPSF
jgi:hypothetical protein